MIAVTVKNEEVRVRQIQRCRSRISAKHPNRQTFEPEPEYLPRSNRNISLNTHYMALFKNPRDAKQITHLGNQMYPGKAKFFQEAFDLATEKPFGYLLLDFKQDTPKALRVRGDIFDFPPCAYVPH